VEISKERPLKAITVTLPRKQERSAQVQPGEFVSLGPDVVPPRRLSGSAPAYPEFARERGMEGSPVVELWINETGDVMDVAIVESAGALLDDAVLQAVTGWRFSPATLGGVPVSIRMTVQHLFRR
jgi:protein TonB